MHSGADRAGRELEPGHGPPLHQPQPVEHGRGRTAPDDRSEPRSAIGDALDFPIERVGRRRRIRPELIALAAALAFVAGAVLIQWGGSAPARETAVPQHGDPARSAGPAAPSSGLPGVDVAAVSADPFGWYDHAWAAVDWSRLAVPDTHSDWGVASASMPLPVAFLSAPSGPSAPTALAPEINWGALASATSRATVRVARGRRVFAFAITWPREVSVTGVTVNYIGSASEPPYITSGGIVAFTEISPLPAAAVVRSSATPPAPVYSPALPTPAGSPVVSGQFWVPPKDTSPLGGSGPPATTWHVLPWPWPMGDYKVTVTTLSGSSMLVLSLQEGA